MTQYRFQPPHTMTEFQHEILEHHHRYTFFYSHGAVIVTVTAHHSVVGDWLVDIMKNSYPAVVGFSFQWNRQVGPDARADVLQLCVADKVLIFQISQAEFLPIMLRDFLLDPCCVFVADNIYSHLPILTRAGLFMLRRPPMDMRLLVDPELANGSLQTIARSYCTTFSPDTHSKLATIADQENSDWAADPLSKDQVEAAALCVHALCIIGRSQYYMRS